ncbi:MAG: biotin synthase BioB [Gammaproteobacteria bacterium]
MQSWDRHTIEKLFEVPLLELIFQAQTIHRANFNQNEVELCTLLNIKTGACPENCSYCPQSGHYKTGVNKESLLSKEEILKKALLAKQNGATRFCMGGAWRNPPSKDFPVLLDIVKTVKELGLETCLTAGMLTQDQAHALKEAELDYYNHNLDTSPEYYDKIITSHTYQDRLDTLHAVREAGVSVCCGGIMGLGESQNDRIEFLLQLINLKKPPESIPINRLIPIPGTPLENQTKIDNFDFIRMIAITRMVSPTSKIRLSAGRAQMSEEMQGLCFMAGANSIHFGEKLLITANPEQDKDINMLKKLGLKPISEKAAVAC